MDSLIIHLIVWVYLFPEGYKFCPFGEVANDLKGDKYKDLWVGMIPLGGVAISIKESYLFGCKTEFYPFKTIPKD